MDHLVRILALSKSVQTQTNRTVAAVLQHQQNQLLKSPMIHHYLIKMIQTMHMKIINMNHILIHLCITMHTFVHLFLPCLLLRRIFIHNKYMQMALSMLINTCIRMYPINTFFNHIRIHILNLFISTTRRCLPTEF